MTYALAASAKRAHSEDGNRQGPGPATCLQPGVPTVCSFSGSSVLQPLSYPYRDLQGRVVQLWKWKEHLIASILRSSSLNYLGRKVCGGYNS